LRRKTFDLILTVGGAALTVVLLAAGALGLWGYHYASSNVHDQLAMQQVTFPAATDAAFKALPAVDRAAIAPYAGQEVLNGPQAKAYADHFIAVHLSEMPYKGVYSAVSTASRANPNDAALKAEVQTVFQGTTLRAMLLEAYAFGTIGEVSLWGAIISFILAGAMLILTALGLWHTRRTPKDLEFPKSFTEEKVLAGV